MKKQVLSLWRKQNSRKPKIKWGSSSYQWVNVMVKRGERNTVLD